MDKTLRHLRKAAGKIGRLMGKATDLFDSDDPLLILPYRGYANSSRIYLKGRVLENENIFDGKSESEIRNIIDSFRRFETDELADANMKIKISDQEFFVKTDQEGYFILDTTWEAPTKGIENRWLSPTIELLDNTKGEEPALSTTGEIYLPSSGADYGIITDVDDTVLQTHVTSLFRLKMLYATFMQDAHKRLPMEGVVELFQSFVKGGDGKRENPIFYVSNSPWNLYDLLEEFMDVQGLPKGPILLRDYGINPSGPFSEHKLASISHVMETYPELPFIMLGDTASKDADFYIDLANKFPNRIKAIYIRQTKNNSNARRVAALIEKHSNINAVLVHSSKEIIAHAREKSFLSKD